MRKQHSGKAASNNTKKIPFGVKLGYGIGTLGYAVPFQLLSGFFLFYCTAILGVSGAVAGALVSASTIWDAVTDPVMGYISDHTSRKILFGRRLFYIFIGAVGFALVNFLLWRVGPQLRGGEAGTVKVVWVAALLMLFKTFSTVYTTPYLALGAELSSDYNERNAVQSYRTAFFFLGFLFPSVLGMSLFFRPTDGYPNGQLNPAAYAALGLTASILTLVCAGVCLALTYKHRLIYSVPKVKRNPIIGLFKEIAEAMKLSDFRNISLALLFFARKYLKLSLLLAVFASGPMTDGMVALLEGALSPALPLWTRLALAVLSCLTLGLGVYLYLLPELGASPADSVGLVLSDLTRLPYRYTRWMTDGLYTLLGWMLGGVVGVNTLLTCLCTGPVIGLYERLLGNTRIARTVRGFCPPAEKK